MKKHDRNLLLAMTIPPLLEFGIVVASFQMPGLLATSATSSGLPAPTALGIIWSAMYVFVFGVVPVFSAIYLWDKGPKIVGTFAVAEALMFYFFFGAHPTPLLGMPTLAWLHIPIAVTVGFALVLKRAFTSKRVMTEVVSGLPSG
ncbi:MAG TPA: hypothetical protein VGR56_05860 [Nitrososphaerales archaeon]|nr:hypothetical protein [Nitrososphaerales archaeon]